MALSRVTTWNSGDVLTAAALNGEFNNIINGGVGIVSPYTATMDASNKQTINFILEKLSAAATAANAARLYYRTDNNLPEYDTGTNIRTVPNFVRSGGQLTFSTPNLLFSPAAHNLIPINGRIEIIPDAGVTLATTGLAISTTYQIYAFMTGATLTLEASTTAKAIQAGTGVPIKTGDATRTWVGTAITSNPLAWTTANTASQWSPGPIAKGDLSIGLGSANSPLNLAVGTNNQILIADSTQTTGIKWGSVPALPAPDFTSAAQTITAGSTLNIAHGLGAKPTLIRSTIQNTVAELGYSIGDAVDIIGGLTNTAVGYVTVSDTTNVTIIMAATLGILNKSTQAGATITAANWQLYVRAWK